MSRATSRQIAAIHATAKAGGLDEAARREVMTAVAGKASSRDLTADEAGRVIERLKALAPSQRSPARRLDGRYASVLRALWLSGWNLGVVSNRRDEALIAFVERQTGIDHPRWLVDPADARKAIEGLKLWLKREAGVAWSDKHFVVHRDEAGQVRGYGDEPCAKRSVIGAQRAILRDLGLPMPDVPASDASPDELDAMIARNGEAIRKARRSG